MDSKSYNIQVAETVRAAMKDAEVSELRLAEASHIPRVTLSRRLSGTVSFSVNELAQIAPIVGKTVADFIPDEVA